MGGKFAFSPMQVNTIEMYPQRRNKLSACFQCQEDGKSDCMQRIELKIVTVLRSAQGVTVNFKINPLIYVI